MYRVGETLSTVRRVRKLLSTRLFHFIIHYVLEPHQLGNFQFICDRNTALDWNQLSLLWALINAKASSEAHHKQQLQLRCMARSPYDAVVSAQCTVTSKQGAEHLPPVLGATSAKQSPGSKDFGAKNRVSVWQAVCGPGRWLWAWGGLKHVVCCIAHTHRVGARLKAWRPLMLQNYLKSISQRRRVENDLQETERERTQVRLSQAKE